MNTLFLNNLNSAINILCPDIWQNMQDRVKLKLSENELWEELVCCILSSQVKYEVSTAFTKKLKKSYLLNYKIINQSYENTIRKALGSPINADGHTVKYRFPNIKARQIVNAWNNIYGSGTTLTRMLKKYTDPSTIRLALINLVPGLGMKQASMYLRNISYSFDLAVIDSHVLKYMVLMKMLNIIPKNINRSQYLMKEIKLIEHANLFGYPVGCVDLAIWVVMRVISKDKII